MNIKLYIILILFLIPIISNAQSDFEKTLKAGEVLVNGLSFFKNSKTENKSSDSKNIESVCIKNKLSEKITLNLTGKDEEGNIQKKELVIQKDSKECIFELSKGIYTYEIVLPNKEIFKKGEYKFNEDTTIIIKTD